VKQSAREIAARLRRAAEVLPENIRRAEAATGRELLQRCIEHSSGSFSAADLRALDHPYARRHPLPLLDPDEVNVESGEFQHAWRLEGPQQRGDRLTTRVFNTSRVAPYLDQQDPPPSVTPMVPRRPQEKAWKETAPHRRIRLLGAIRDSFR
jgi:hypothetical protein